MQKIMRLCDKSLFISFHLSSYIYRERPTFVAKVIWLKGSWGTMGKLLLMWASYWHIADVGTCILRGEAIGILQVWASKLLAFR